MSLAEFEIIHQFFQHDKKSVETVIGIGDDAAVMTVPCTEQLVTSIDTLNAGVHFPHETSAFDIGYKALAVSLSDMAAMGAKPKTVLLSLTLPRVNEQWLQEFSSGFFSLAEQHHVHLIGGDTSQGPLAISTVVNGFVPENQALTRSGAKVGEGIFVTGHLGDAGLALKHLLAKEKNIEPALLSRLNRPIPRVSAGLLLRDFASSAMDISDGLVADLTKLCAASKVGAVIRAQQVPLSRVLKSHCTQESALEYALCAGDDYELLFTLPMDARKHLDLLDCSTTLIGEILSEEGVSIRDQNGKKLRVNTDGYEHFT